MRRCAIMTQFLPISQRVIRSRNSHFTQFSHHHHRRIQQKCPIICNLFNWKRAKWWAVRFWHGLKCGQEYPLIEVKSKRSSRCLSGRKAIRNYSIFISRPRNPSNCYYRSLIFARQPKLPGRICITSRQKVGAERNCNLWLLPRISEDN